MIGGPPRGGPSHIPGMVLPPAQKVLVPEDLVSSPAGNRLLIKVEIHSRDGPAPLQACQDLRHTQLHI